MIMVQNLRSICEESIIKVEYDGLYHVAHSKITIYHTFHDEVESCRKWWWRCDGPCRNKPPYYGYVKRAMNRPPQKADWWFANHQVGNRTVL